MSNGQILVIEQEAELKASALIVKRLLGPLLVVSIVKRAGKVLRQLSKACIYQKVRLNLMINPCSPSSMGMSLITSSHSYNRISTLSR